MKKLILYAIIIAGLGSISAQSYVKHFPEALSQVKSFQGNDSLKILAVMVEFQEDRYDATVGNGKFGSIYSHDYGDTIIDPLPHNAQYFEDHLLFAKNYFKKVSNGKVNISYKVLPEVLTVSKYMRDYSPGYNSTDFTNIGNLSKEVWELADQNFSSVKFSDYDLFIIFHAGVSSGIDLGTYSIDRNLPSIYMSSTALKKIFGNDFNGISVNNGSSYVTNSIIMAETESREYSDVQNNVYLYQFSINGLLVNNIASYMGLPDLFNTTTGRSVIGRFGLMDSQGMNANYGMFPPDLSPWEKIYLGWETPVTISNANQRINLAARLVASTGDTTLIKIPINSSEYFLVENRQQDALNNLVNVVYKKNGNTYTKTFHPDTSGYYYYIVPDSIDGGVVVDVDELDAAVPGNGIVIWHIDEDVINKNLSANTVNNGDVRGVAVVEADGINDIGELFTTVFGTTIGEGSEDDLWFKDNEAELYKNSFSNSTKPSSKTNSGANSLITIDNFAAASNKMGFNIEWGSGSLNLLAKVSADIGNNNRMLTASNFSDSNSVLIIGNTNLSIYNLNGKLEKTINDFSDILPVAFSYNSVDYIIGAKDNFINIYSKNSGIEKLSSITCESEVTALSVDKQQTVPYFLISTWGTTSEVHLLSLTDLLNQKSLGKSSFVIYNGDIRIKSFGVGQSFYSFLGDENFIEYSNQAESISIEGQTRKSIFSRNIDGNYVSVILMKDNRFVIHESRGSTSQFQIDSEDSITSFSVADILNNGKHYIVFANGNKIEAYSFNGVEAENSPFTLYTGEKFVNTPLIADIDNNGVQDIIAFTDAGNIYGIDPVKAQTLSFFPISFGAGLSATPAIVKQISPNSNSSVYPACLSLLTENNDLYSWQIGSDLGKSCWLGEFGDSYNSSFVDMPQSSTVVTEYFPSDKAYNWPNPVYENETNIRYYVSENSNVKIKIFDLAGDFVAELNDRALGGYDNETKWNVSNIQSGVYFARLSVKSDNGQSAEKIIKIAVIK
jgi:hypothetical protein